MYLKTSAAIKLLRTRVSNQVDLEGFLTEAQTIAQLIHPHIVRVLEFGLDGETPYLVMDYASGGTLRERYPRGTQLSLTTIIPYVKHIADALQYAHEEKFIHRDVKPIIAVITHVMWYTTMQKYGLFDRKFSVRKVWHKVKPDEHANEVLEVVEALHL